MSMLGHNNPPPSPFDDLEALYSEARHWLDGASVQSQQEADAIAKLLTMARDVEKSLEAARVAEKKPHDDAAKAVQERFKPFLSKCDLVKDAAKKALAPWLQRIEAEKREAERLAREEADRKRAEAEAAIRAAKQQSLEEREAAEALLRDAKQAEADAARAEKQKARAETGGKAIGLKTTYEPRLTSLQAAAAHYWKTRRDEIEALMIDLARKDVRAGTRDIPGFEVVAIQEAV